MADAKTTDTKTAEEKARRETDAFEYGMGLTLKAAGITDPTQVREFLEVARQVATQE
jgi:hypothetical protein